MPKDWEKLSKVARAGKLDDLNDKKIGYVDLIYLGYWQPMSTDYQGYTNEFECSVCEGAVQFNYKTRTCPYDYCPWCGANNSEE